MKKLKLLTPAILSLVIFLCFVFRYPVYKSNIANGITGDKIKEIKIGMTLEQVISILGKPYEIVNLNGQHDFSCKNPMFLKKIVDKNTNIIHIVDSIFNGTCYCCDDYREDIQRIGKKVTLIYAKKYSTLATLFIYYPMLWVHLDSNYRVNHVFAKRYEFFDSICIYSLSGRLDETTPLEEIPGEVSLFINEELFNKCFKK